MLEGVCPGEVVLEDRTHLTLGARRRDTELAGYPVTVVIGKKVSVLLVAFCPFSTTIREATSICFGQN